MRATIRETIGMARQRHVLKWLLALLAVGAALLIASGFLIAKRSTDNCTAALKVRDAIVAVLVDAQRRTQQAPPQTQQEEQRRRADEFYAHAIQTLHDVNCHT